MEELLLKDKENLLEAKIALEYVNSYNEGKFPKAYYEILGQIKYIEYLLKKIAKKEIIENQNNKIPDKFTKTNC